MTIDEKCKTQTCLFLSVVFVLTLGSAHLATAQTCVDVSAHESLLVEVNDEIIIETLDWGGDGPVLVFLPGLGNTAHVFDRFALQFSPQYRVISVSRRGFGRSSKPDTGYSTADRVSDIIGVLDYLDVSTAAFAGHSIAGDELSYLGANYVDRVSGLIYLDAYDYGDGALMKYLSDAPPEFLNPVNPPTRRDSISVGHYQSYMARTMGLHFPYAEICAGWETDEDGVLTRMTFLPQNANAIFGDTHEAEFEKISAPSLGIFATREIVTEDMLEPLSDSLRSRVSDTGRALDLWKTEQVIRFQSRLPNRQVEVIQDSDHYVFMSNTAETTSLMLSFLESLSAW